MVLFLGFGPPFVNPGVRSILVGTLINIRRRHRHSGQRPSCSVVHFPSRGRARWVGGRRWALSRTSPIFPRVRMFISLLFLFFFDKTLYSFLKGMVSLLFLLLLGVLVAKWEPTPCYRDAYSVGTPQWALLGERLANDTTVRPRFPPFCGRLFSG